MFAAELSEKLEEDITLDWTELRASPDVQELMGRFGKVGWMLNHLLSKPVWTHAIS